MGLGQTVNEECYRGLATVLDHAVVGSRRGHPDLLGVGDFDDRCKQSGTDVVVAELLPGLDSEGQSDQFIVRKGVPLEDLLRLDEEEGSCWVGGVDLREFPFHILLERVPWPSATRSECVQVLLVVCKERAHGARLYYGFVVSRRGGGSPLSDSGGGRGWGFRIDLHVLIASREGPSMVGGG